jgi:hypothetical protein
MALMVVLGLVPVVAAQAPESSTLELAPGAVAEGIEQGLAFETIAVDEVQRGQSGYGISVFEGTTAERFEVDVVGVLRDFSPGISFILGRLRGHELEETGVIAGMSGSPVYIDGRLAGAVAFSWDFSTGAIAGITPIRNMRDLWALPGRSVARPVAELGRARNLQLLVSRDPFSDDPVTHDPATGEMGRLDLDEHLATVGRLLVGGDGVFGIAGARSSVQFAASGWSSGSRELLGRALGQVSPSGRLTTSTDLDARTLVPGAAVAAILVAGDFELAASGTVTDRRDDEVLAFGHPLFGLGPVDVPMAPAEVVTVVPSRLSSFKLTNVGAPIGAFDEDRLTGIRGRIGAVSPMMPLRVRVRSGTSEAGSGLLGGDQEYHLELANLELMRPSLAATSVLQALDAAGHLSGDQGLDLHLRFDLGARGELELEQAFDGSSAAMDSAIYLLRLVAFFELNELEDVDVRSIDVEATRHPTTRTANIERAVADHKQVRPGENVTLRLTLQGPGGERFERATQVPIPADTRPGPYYLFVGDASSIDGLKLQIEPVETVTVDAAIALLRTYHSSAGIGVLAVRPAPGVVLDGTAFPDLPASVRATLQAPAPRLTKRLSLIIDHEQFEAADRPLSGAVRIDLEVLPARSAAERG